MAFLCVVCEQEGAASDVERTHPDCVVDTGTTDVSNLQGQASQSPTRFWEFLDRDQTPRQRIRIGIYDANTQEEHRGDR